MARQKPVLSEKDRYSHTPIALKSWDERELRKEYSRLRTAANKRIAALGRSEFKDTPAYAYNAGVYIPLAAIENRSELEALTAQVSRFLLAKTGSVSGLRKQRKETLKTLQEHGFDFVDRNNLQEFGKFMEWARSQGWTTKKVNGRYAKPPRFASDRIAELYGASEELGLTTKDLENIKADFKNYLKEIEKLRSTYDNLEGRKRSIARDKAAETFRQYDKRHQKYLESKKRRSRK